MRRTTCPLIIAMVAFGAGMLAPQLAVAQFAGPSGSFTNTVSAPTNAVWDVGGVFSGVNFSVTNKDGMVVSVSYPLSVEQLGRGRLFGVGDTSVQLGIQGTNLPVAGRYLVTGSVSSSRSRGHALLSSTVFASADILGKIRKVTASHSISVKFDNVAQTASAVVKDSVSASGMGRISGHESFDKIPMSSVFAGNGSWSYTMTLSTSGKKVTGTASVRLNSRQVFNFSVNGAFKARDGTSKLVLTGADQVTLGSTLKVTMNADTVTSIKGKISGQSVSATF